MAASPPDTAPDAPTTGAAAPGTPAPDAPASDAAAEGLTDDALSNVDLETVTRLRLAVLRISRRLRRHAASGVTPSQLSVLSTVGAHGSLSLGDLAAHEGVQPPSVTRMVASLEEAGLLRRSGSPGDRRTVIVSLTEQGRTTLDDIRRRRDAWMAARMGRLSDGEVDALHRALPVLERILEDGA